MTVHRPWLLAAIVLAVVGLVVVGFVLLRPGSQPFPIDYYRVIDDDTIVIGTTAGSGETRVTKVDESSESVVITVQFFSSVFDATTSEGSSIELTVDLEAPLDGREVRDPYQVVPLRD